MAQFLDAREFNQIGQNGVASSDLMKTGVARQD